MSIQILTDDVAILRATCEAYAHCAESLRAERDTLTAELTLAKQAAADALHELRSADGAIREAYCKATLLQVESIAEDLATWLDTHAQQTKAPMIDHEAEAEQVKERELEDR